MFAENFKMRDLELSRIKNISEFGVNLQECKIHFSRDLNFAILWTETSILIVDMNKKSIISKFSNERSWRIQKLKITPKNGITYLNKTSDQTKFVVTSLDFFSHSFERTVSADVIDYVYVDYSKTNQKFFITLSSKGVLDTYASTHGDIKIKRKNILQDCLDKIKFDFQVNHMDFIDETKNLLIIMSNGTILNYVLALNPEYPKDDIYLLDFEEIRHLESPLGYDSKTNFRNVYEVATFQITKFVYEEPDFIFIEREPENKEIEEESQETKKNEAVYLSLATTVNKSTSFFYFYLIQDNNLLFLNKIRFEQRFILDSYIYQSNNDILNHVVSDYFIVCCQNFLTHKVEVLALDFVECLGRKRNEILPREEFTQGDFKVVSEFEDYNIRKLGITGVYVLKNPSFLANKLQVERNFEGSSIIDDYKNIDYSVNLSLRKIKNISNFDLYVQDDFIDQVFKKLGNEEFIDKKSKALLTIDVNKHLSIKEEISKSEKYTEILTNFKQYVIKLIDEEPFIKPTYLDKRPQLHMDDNKIDFYLLNLLLSNELLAMKYYLSLRESLSSSNQFIVTNYQLYCTVSSYFLNPLRENIIKFLKEKDYKNLKDDRLLVYLENIHCLMMTCIYRYFNLNGKPFDLEFYIADEEIKIVERICISVSLLILVIKVIRSYLRNVVENMDGEIGYIHQAMADSMRKRKNFRLNRLMNEKNKITYFELIMMDYEQHYPDMSNFIITVIEHTRESELKNLRNFERHELPSEDIFYFLKFQIFFYYMYYLQEYYRLIREQSSNMLLEANSSKIKQENFQEMHEEFDMFYSVGNDFYMLDTREENKPINISKMSKFVSKFNKSGIASTKYFKENVNRKNINFNSLLISLLYLENYKVESLALSKSIINMLSDIDDLMTQLSILQDMGLVNLAYQFVNNCFGLLVLYKDDLEDESTLKNKEMMSNLVSTEEFKNMKQLYFHFYEFLITNEHVGLLFTLPYNFIERYILKEFLLTRKEYEELIILYLIKIRKIKQAEETFIDLYNSNSFSEISASSYRSLINTMKFLFSGLANDSEEVEEIEIKPGQEMFGYNVFIKQEKKVVAEVGEKYMHIDRDLKELAGDIFLGKIL
jgi:hypothetical protein